MPLLVLVYFVLVVWGGGGCHPFWCGFIPQKGDSITPNKWGDKANRLHFEMQQSCCILHDSLSPPFQRLLVCALHPFGDEAGTMLLSICSRLAASFSLGLQSKWCKWCIPAGLVSKPSGNQPLTGLAHHHMLLLPCVQSTEPVQAISIPHLCTWGSEQVTKAGSAACFVGGLHSIFQLFIADRYPNPKCSLQSL